MNITDFLNRDDYLQNPIMRRFLKEHNVKLVENRADYIKAIKEYSEKGKKEENEVTEWLLKIAKEGTKEFCYKKLYDIEDWHRNPTLVEKKIKEKYPNCPRKNILTYTNTGEIVMINYDIVANSENEVRKIEFTFSKLCLYGDAGTAGSTTIFPVFIEIYLEEGFAVSRGKAKSTLYPYDENNNMIFGKKIDTMSYAVDIMDKVIAALELSTDTNPKRVKNVNSQMFYSIYEKYSFTPEEVKMQVASQDDVIKGFVSQIFSNLCLDVKNKEKALLDAKILVEKFVSINGDNESVFKEDRPAYLIKVSADDESELTKIDTTSDKSIPLQCTDAFFDSKKYVVKSKMCKKLNLIYKRENENVFPKCNYLVVQFGTNKNYGYVKTTQYAEEADIQNVLQTIFENYGGIGS